MIASADWNSSAPGCCVAGPTGADSARSVVVASADSTSVGSKSGGPMSAAQRTGAWTIVRAEIGACVIAVRLIGARSTDGRPIGGWRIAVRGHAAPMSSYLDRRTLLRRGFRGGAVAASTTMPEGS